jgi:hypothetical protein
MRIPIHNTAGDFSLNVKFICKKFLKHLNSVADPRCLSGSEFFQSRIPDPIFFHPGSRIRIKEFKYINPKKMVSNLSEIWPGLFIPDPEFLPIPGPGVKKAPNPGSATLVSKSKSTYLGDNAGLGLGCVVGAGDGRHQHLHQAPALSVRGQRQQLV